MRDDSYLTAIENGSTDYVAHLVEQAARDAGYTTPKLYHGTNRFGFTQFDGGFFYATTKQEVAANYAGKENYAGARPVNRKLMSGDSSRALIHNAKSVLGQDYHAATEAERTASAELVLSDVRKVNEQMEAAYDALWELPNFAPENANYADTPQAFYDTMGNLFSSVETYANAVHNGTVSETVYAELSRNAAAFEEAYGKFREYLADVSDDVKGKDAQKAYRHLTGHAVFDAFVDVQSRFLPTVRPNTETFTDGSGFLSKEDLADRIDTAKKIGAYALYGNVGSNPLVVEANGGSWAALEVPEMGDGAHTTDNIARWAKENGYTSVIVRNVQDGGVTADDYIFFNVEQAKSADTVTYDDNGDVIPLSERFKRENADIRYSLREDSEGRELSDGQEDYFAESAIRDKNGALQVMYHATDNEFTVFSREYLGENTDAWSEEAQATAHIGFWFNTQDLSKHSKSLYTRAEEVYLNVTNPYDAEDLHGLVDEIAAVNEGSSEDPSEIGEKFRDWLEENGYDGVRLHDEEFGGTSVVALYPEQIKRTDNLNPTKNADIRYSVREGMSEEERYEALKDATIRVPAYDSENGVLTQQSVANLERMINRDARYYVSELFDKLGIGGTYENKAANIVFNFGSHGKSKSIHEQGARRNGFSDFAKMLTNFDAIVENAVPIEIHSDKYKGTRRENADLRQVSVFVSAFYDNGGIVPVQFEVKEYANRANELYVIVSLQKIRNAVFAAGRASAEDTFAATVRIPYEVSLQELFSKINPSDGDFLKYVPDGFLSEEHRSAKQAALMREERKIDGLRFSLRDTSSVDIATVENENAQLREANEELRKQFQRTVGVQLDQKAIRTENAQEKQKLAEEYRRKNREKLCSLTRKWAAANRAAVRPPRCAFLF